MREVLVSLGIEVGVSLTNFLNYDGMVLMWLFVSWVLGLVMVVLGTYWCLVSLVY